MSRVPQRWLALLHVLMNEVIENMRYSRSKAAVVIGYCAFKCQMKIKCH